jgi:hypothetical protein
MPVQAQLGVVGEIRADLEEEGAEVPIHAVDVVVVHHGGGADQPGIGLTRVRVAPLLGAHHGRLLLCLADEEHALLLGEPRQMLRRHLVFAPPLAKVSSGTLCVWANRSGGHKGGADRVHQRRGGERGPRCARKKCATPAALCSSGTYTLRYIRSMLDFQGHMLPQDRRDGGGL